MEMAWLILDLGSAVLLQQHRPDGRLLSMRCKETTAPTSPCFLVVYLVSCRMPIQTLHELPQLKLRLALVQVQAIWPCIHYWYGVTLLMSSAISSLKAAKVSYTLNTSSYNQIYFPGGRVMQSLFQDSQCKWLGLLFTHKCKELQGVHSTMVMGDPGAKCPGLIRKVAPLLHHFGSSNFCVQGQNALQVDGKACLHAARGMHSTQAKATMTTHTCLLWGMRIFLRVLPSGRQHGLRNAPHKRKEHRRIHHKIHARFPPSQCHVEPSKRQPYHGLNRFSTIDPLPIKSSNRLKC